MRSREISVFFAFAVLAALPRGAAAQINSSICTVGVRVINAISDAANPSAETEQESQLFRDLGDQLRKLPFSQYRTVDYVEKQLRFNQRGKFVLQGAAADEHYMVAVLPQGAAADRVSLNVDWEDGSGAKLVSTRMKVPSGKHVVLGSEGNNGSSTIVSIHAICPKAQLSAVPVRPVGQQ